MRRAFDGTVVNVGESMPPPVDIRSRNDMMSPPAPSLPPNQKLVKDLWGDAFLLALLGIGLLAAKWTIITGEKFGELLGGVLIVKAMSGKGLTADMLSFLRRS